MLVFKAMTIRDLLPQYAEYLLHKRKRAPGTVREYIRRLNHFSALVGDIKITKVTQLHVDAWEMQLNKAGSTNNYVNQSLVTLREFLRYAERKGINCLKADLIELPKPEEYHPDFLYPDEVKALLRATTTSRDKAAIAMLYDSGIRVAELTSLKVSDLNLKLCEGVVIGKGNKQRFIFFSQAVARLLMNHIEREELRASDLVFNLTTRQIQRIVKAAALKANIQKKTPITPHTLRHSFATTLRRNGTDISDMSVLLGHKNLSTTQIYTHYSSPQLKKAHAKLHAQVR